MPGHTLYGGGGTATAPAAACCLRDRKNARCHRKTTFSLAANRRRPAAALPRQQLAQACSRLDCNEPILIYMTALLS